MIDKEKLAAAITAEVLKQFALAFDNKSRELAKDPLVDVIQSAGEGAGYLSVFLMNVWNEVSSKLTLKAAISERIENELPQEESHPRLQDCIDRLQAIRKQLNQWAQQSVTGGWSTHQVQPQRQLAAQIQQFLDSF